MSGFDPLVERATRRLSRDRELRGEVSRELVSHLAASAAEYRRAGYAETDADDAAAKDFGDPDEVADALWQANRSRVRLRAWAWWAARLTLVPACVAATAWFLISGMTYLGAAGELGAGPIDAGSALLSRYAEARVRSRMTERQRLIYYGDEDANNPIAAAEGLRDAFPDEPLYQLNYLTRLLAYFRPEGADDTRADWQRQATAAAVLDAVCRGRGLDPDNGIYDLTEAAVRVKPWFDAQPGAPLTFTRDGERTEVTPLVFGDGVDEAALAEALSSLERAAAKPYVSTHSVDMLRHRLEQLLPPRSMQEYIFRISGEIGTMGPSLGYRRLVARVVTCEAVRRARAGDRDGALGWLDTLDTLNAKLAAGDDTLIGFLVSASIEALERETRVAVHAALGDDAAAARAQAHAEALERKYQREFNDPGERRATEAKVERGGLLMAMLMPAIPGYDVDVAPFRRAEYALVDRAALSAGLIGLIFISLVLSTVGVLGGRGWRRGPAANGDKAVLLWIGWRRLGVVLGGAVGLPVLGFVGWSLTPWSGRGYGLNHTAWPLLAYAPLAVLIAGLLWCLGIEALRRRAKEVGLGVPDTARWWVSGAVLGGLTLGLSAWWAGMFHVGSLAARDDRSLDEWVVVLVVGAVAWVLAAWLAVAGSLARLSGVEKPLAGVLRGLGFGLGVGAVCLILIGSVVWSLTDAIDRVMFVAVVGVFAAGGGLAVGWLRTARRPGATRRFARSALRSPAPVAAAAGLLMALIIGPALTWWERALVRGVVAETPVWMDQEIEKSNAKVLRAYLAGDEVGPPRCVPGG